MNQQTTVHPIDTVLQAFARGDAETLLRHIDEQIDFRIDHYRDETDVSWQRAHDRQGLVQVLQRLGQEVFPKGTRIVSATSTALGGDWVVTQLRQQFHYGLQDRMVDSRSCIISHSSEGRCDYFRETVATVEALEGAAA